MRAGELYTSKDDIMGYKHSLKEDDPYLYRMMGYVIIELVRYLGHDRWEFRNLGTASLEMYPDKFITGEKIMERFTKIGHVDDPGLLTEIKAENAEMERQTKESEPK